MRIDWTAFVVGVIVSLPFIYIINVWWPNHKGKKK